MAKQETTASLLLEGVAKNYRLARGIKAYLETGDESHLLKIPAKLHWEDASLIDPAVLEAGKTPESAAVFTAACCRIAANPPQDEDELCADLANKVLRVGDTRPFVETALERDLPPLQLAKFWMIHLGYKLNFGWQALTHDVVFGESVDARIFRWELADSPKFNAIEELILGLPDGDMLSLLQAHELVAIEDGRKSWHAGNLQGVLARDRPDVFKAFLKTLKTPATTLDAVDWRCVLTATDIFDDDCLAYCERTPSDQERIESLIFLDHLRGGAHLNVTRDACLKGLVEEIGTILVYLASADPEGMLPLLIKHTAAGSTDEEPDFVLTECSRVAAQRWNTGGAEYFAVLLEIEPDVGGYYPDRRHASGLAGSLTADPLPDAAHGWVTSFFEKHSKMKADSLAHFWKVVAEHQPALFSAAFWDLLQHKSKTLRTVASDALASARDESTLTKAAELLTAKKVDSRLGAAELLEVLADSSAAALLKAAIEGETSEKVRAAFHAALTAVGETSEASAVSEIPLENLEAEFEKLSKKLKIPPKATWLDLDALPALPTQEGPPLSELALTFLIAKQSKHKPISLAPDILPLAAHIDRNKGGDFALAMLKQWLGSEQAAADRWALTFAGWFGDQRVLPELTSPIQAWAENARHKLAEYAAQAIALVPGDEALMILDSLANRYRSRFKNIGTACRAALEEAAADRGVSMDELADMIVPDLGFNQDHDRPLPDSPIRVVLQPDFKLTFFNPETDKESKSPPSTLSDSAKEDIKTLRKLIRETVKGQTARLELSLVRERQWPTKRWTELFEEHPILQSFATRLVWRSIDKNGAPNRIFRRYPNGLLADASGDLIEFDDSDHAISMVHPLHLAPDMLTAWQQHLTRMKVSPPFPQLDRPVALLDPQHGNRKTLATADAKEVSVGTFRSRAEKRGWIRGSVVDGGGITSYHKNFSEAEVDVFLHVAEMWVGQDPQDVIKLGAAFFVPAESVSTGSYEYDEPENADDKRVLSFSQVPAIVYSETVTDLQTISG